MLQPNENGIYGRISFFRQWIDDEMTNPTYCGGTPDANTATTTTPGTTVTTATTATTGITVTAGI